MSSDTIIIAGAPVITSLNGTFFLVDTTTTGYDRVWRNKGPSAIYHDDSGWKLADIVTGSIYFSEAKDDNSASAENPWECSWTSESEIYNGYLTKITVRNNIDEPIETVEHVKDNEETVEYGLTTDHTFQAVKNYYIRKGEQYIPVRLIVAATKIDPNTFYELDSKLNLFVITTDTYFLSGKAYYTRNGSNYVEAKFIESDIPQGEYYNAIGKTTTNLIVTTNNLTGYKSTEETISTVTDVDNVQMHHRFYVPNVEVGRVYRFAFVKDFRYLGYMPPTSEDYAINGDSYSDNEISTYNDSDITRGIFRIDNITNYYDLVLSGIDVYQNLYLPLGLSRDLYEEDRKKWMNNDIWYKLVDPVLESRVFYVPLGIVNGIPDGNVTEYERHHLVIDIGLFRDPEFLSDLVTCINMLLKAKFGISSAAQLASYDKVYIPDCYYNWLNDKRKQSITDFMNEFSTKYYRTLFYDKYNEIYKENLDLNQRVKAYETILKEMQQNG